jgi:hypothetical protein
MKITWNMLYKVGKGLRNFGTKRAQIVANASGTDPMIWMDLAHKDKRPRFIEMIAESLGITKKRQAKVEK